MISPLKATGSILTDVYCKKNFEQFNGLDSNNYFEANLKYIQSCNGVVSVRVLLWNVFIL